VYGLGDGGWGSSVFFLSFLRGGVVLIGISREGARGKGGREINQTAEPSLFRHLLLRRVGVGVYMLLLFMD